MAEKNEWIECLIIPFFQLYINKSLQMYYVFTNIKQNVQNFENYLEFVYLSKNNKRFFFFLHLWINCPQSTSNQNCGNQAV